MQMLFVVHTALLLHLKLPAEATVDTSIEEVAYELTTLQSN